MCSPPPTVLKINLKAENLELDETTCRKLVFKLGSVLNTGTEACHVAVERDSGQLESRWRLIGETGYENRDRHMDTDPALSHGLLVGRRVDELIFLRGSL